MLFEKVKEEHILQGIKDYEEKGLPNGFGASSTYDLVYDNKTYPPKAIMAYANFYASDRKIERYFKGGLDTDCFKAFERNNFKIEKKKGNMNLKEEFKQWLNTNIKKSSGAKSSYVRAIDLLEIPLGYNVFSIQDIDKLNLLYRDLLEKQTDVNSKYYNADVPSYGKDRYYSAGIAKYIEFIKEKNKNEKFTWVKTHLAITDYLKDKKNEQTKLIEILKNAGVTGFSDRDVNNVDIDLKVIDPFTFFCYIYKYGDSRRLQILQNISEQLNIHYPKDECGIPSSNAQKVWLFPYKELRVNNEIERLWSFFFQVLKDEINNNSFEDLLKIRGIARTKLTEALFNVNPKKYFPINGPTKPYLESVFGINPKFKTFDDYKNILNQLQSKTDKPFYQLSYEAWLWNEEQNNKQNQDMKYWIYAPGRNAEFWDEFYKQGIMGLGWDSLGDLTKYDTKESIEKKLQELNNVTTSKRNNATANFEFANTMNIGDVIIVKTGRSNLLGYGIVASDYYFDDSRNVYTSCRKVDWKLKGNWKLEHKLVLKTLTDITRYKEDNGTNYYDGLMNIMMNNSTKEIEKNIVSIPKNQILYGPPGTGKTYKTKELAVQISNPNFLYDENWSDEEKREAIVNEYDKLCIEGKVVFTTFHQSMSYEDFVEGIKPKTEDGKVTYEIENGIFKELSSKASQKTISNFKEAYNLLVKEFSDNDNEFLTLKTPKDKEFRVRLNSNNNLSLFTTNKSSQQGTFTKEKLEQHLYYKNAFNGWEGYANAILNYLKENFKLSNKGINHRNYTLIIDEINRGNVSGVFGELITLLEDDKRIGQKEAIKITLPYSKDEFGVPSNLYIIGTMNTADRSVEALDTALRRRFSFTEVAPDSKLLKDKEIEEIALEKLLQTINDRIEILIDKDHKIGHSYFLTIETIDDLKQTFKNKVIPLLEEYFFGDYGKIGLVLGSAFIKLKDDEDKISFAKSFTEKYEDAENLREKAVYTFTDEDSWVASSFISIYEQ